MLPLGLHNEKGLSVLSMYEIEEAYTLCICAIKIIKVIDKLISFLKNLFILVTPFLKF